MILELYYNSIIRQHFLEKFISSTSKSAHVGNFLRVLLSGSFQRKPKYLLYLYSNLYGIELLSQQRPLLTKAKKSIAGFSLKQNSINGFKSTLRKDYMYLFLYRYSHIALPRLKDFIGHSHSLISGASLNVGHSSLLMFPEIDMQYDLFKDSIGFNLSIQTSCKTKHQTLFLLRHLQIPVIF